MNDAIVTIFNFYESSTAAIWYPHVLSGVHLETDRGQIMKLYGTDSTDNAQLHIPFGVKDGRKIVVDTVGKELPCFRRRNGTDRSTICCPTALHLIRLQIFLW